MLSLTKSSILLALLGASSVMGKIYFKETFDDDKWKRKWVTSRSRGDYGDWKVEHGEYFADKQTSRALRTSQDARFYMISAPLNGELDNSDKPMVVQYTVKLEPNKGNSIYCGGGYIKLYPPGLDPSRFDSDTEYNIMFGPDICGGEKKTHVILNHNGENKQIKRLITPNDDMLTHLYTFTLYPNATYQVLLDHKEDSSGSLFDDWDLLPPRKILDPSQSKPANWVDRKYMDDPNSKKPAGYDAIPETIADPEAKQPSHWDEELDGEWEAPQIPNPNYRGVWRARQVPNPNYKGPWIHPLVDNPDYYDDGTSGHYVTAHVGIDLWQVKAGTMFDDFIITDSPEEARKFAAETFDIKQPLEAAHKAKKDAEEKKKQDKEARSRKKDKRRRPSDDDDEDDEDEDEEL